MILSYEDIEHISAAVTHDFLSTVPAAEQKYAVDIDALAKEYLGLDVSYRTLSEDGSVLGVTAYSDTAYTCKLNGEGIVVPLKRSHILIDRRLLGFYEPKKNRRRRFTLAHEGAHQILFQLEAPEVQAACRSKYRAVAYSLRELKSHEDWNEWQANALGAALLMPEDRLKAAFRKMCGDKPLTAFGGCLTQRAWLLIGHLSSAFNVSFTAMKIRLKKLGQLVSMPRRIAQDILEMCVRAGRECIRQCRPKSCGARLSWQGKQYPARNRDL